MSNRETAAARELQAGSMAAAWTEGYYAAWDDRAAGHQGPETPNPYLLAASLPVLPETREGEMGDLQARMGRAASRLEERATAARGREQDRLLAKADGVRLALSYLPPAVSVVEPQPDGIVACRELYPNSGPECPEILHAHWHEIRDGEHWVHPGRAPLPVETKDKT